MKLEIDIKSTIASGAFGAGTSRLLMTLEGRKSWIGASQLRFETTEHNLRSFRAIFPNTEERDKRMATEAMDGGQGLASWGKDVGSPIHLPRSPLYDHACPPFKTKPYNFQLRAFQRFKDAPIDPRSPQPGTLFALFGEAGTGKTKTTIDILCHRWLTNQITGALIFTKKGVHHQWVEEQLPEHMWDIVEWEAEAWGGKRWKMEPRAWDKLQIWVANTDMVKSDRSRVSLWPFVKTHGRSWMMVVDEAHDIKNVSSKRSQKIHAIGACTDQRAIMTGTPIAVDLTDEWAQFKFLDERIIGQKYKTAFMAQFCLIGGFDGRTVIGHRNLEHFNQIVAPFIFRVTKEEVLDLPPKIYDTVLFDLSDTQKVHLKSLKENFLTQLDNGEVSTVLNAAAMLMRVQQLTCGYIIDDEGGYTMLEENPRLDALENLCEHREGKKIIWCRFNHDVELLSKRYGSKAVTYHGPTKPADREIARQRFLDPNSGIEFFIANPAAAGTGLNLQGHCRTAIYYSNSFNAIDRWQSEDRIHRIGMIGSVTYFDLVARGSFDRKILANLRNKKSLSDLVLDDLRRLVDDL